MIQIKTCTCNSSVNSPYVLSIRHSHTSGSYIVYVRTIVYYIACVYLRGESECMYTYVYTSVLLLYLLTNYHPHTLTPSHPHTLTQYPSVTLYPPHYDAVSSFAIHNNLLFSACGRSFKQWDTDERQLKQVNSTNTDHMSRMLTNSQHIYHNKEVL